jgi:hypothetical protein
MRVGRSAVTAFASVLAVAVGDVAVVVAAPPEAGDIRGLRVGVAATELPVDGFTGFACTATGEAIAGWVEQARCPAGADGLREVSVRYDEAAQVWAAVNDAWEGTKVAGHPVLLSVLFDEGGTAEALRVVTDPEARLYYRKKAFLLGLRIMGRYGPDGWSCADDQPDAGRTPVGGMLIARRCEKDLPDRRLMLRTDLYRAPGQAGRDFTDATRFEIWRRAG